MSFAAIFAVSLIAGLAYLSRRMTGDSQLERPIVIGPIVGLIMGDPYTGLMAGATLELVFMGAQAIGGSVPANVAVACAVGTALAISNNTGAEVALIVAIPAAVFAALFELIAKSVTAIFAHGVDRCADTANHKGIILNVHAGNLLHFLSYFIPAFIALFFGEGVIQAMANALPANVQAGFDVMGKLLPALGFGLLLSNLSTKKLMPYFFIGFAIAAYVPAFGVMGVSVLGAAFVVLYVNTRKADSAN